MGGVAHGEVAAQIVVDVLPTYVEKKRQSSGISDADGASAAAVAELSDELHAGRQGAGRFRCETS